MNTFVLILIGIALAGNAALAHFYGLDPALRAPPRLRDTLALALATGALLIVASLTAWATDLVLDALGAAFLHVPAWLLIVVALTPFAVLLLRRWAPNANLQRTLAPALLLGNGLLLGAIASTAQAGFIVMLARTLGVALGYGIALLLFAAIGDRLDGADVPRPFRGLPILLITAAIIALAFMGFAGIGRP